MPGYSQSTSIPSKTPAAEPGPPADGGQIVAGSDGRLPFSSRSTHEATNAWRVAGVAATSEKYFEPVQPPSDITTRRLGCAAFSFSSWLKFPYRCWFGFAESSAMPSTLWSAPVGAS